MDRSLENSVNIFYLNKNPLLAAHALCDKHVVKMPLEYAQLLSTFVHWRYGPCVHESAGLYKPCYVNHPCNIWLRETIYAVDWLIVHAVGACNEYAYRYERQHASRLIISRAMLLILGPGFHSIDSSLLCNQPPQCMPDDCRVHGDAVTAYRKYYLTHKKHILHYTKREKPDWMIQ